MTIFIQCLACGAKPNEPCRAGSNGPRQRMHFVRAKKIPVERIAPLTAPCPTCKSKATKACVTTDGDVREPHLDRVRRAAMLLEPTAERKKVPPSREREQRERVSVASMMSPSVRRFLGMAKCEECGAEAGEPCMTDDDLPAIKPCEGRS